MSARILKVHLKYGRVWYPDRPSAENSMTEPSKPASHAQLTGEARWSTVSDGGSGISCDAHFAIFPAMPGVRWTMVVAPCAIHVRVGISLEGHLPRSLFSPSTVRWRDPEPGELSLGGHRTISGRVWSFIFPLWMVIATNGDGKASPFLISMDLVALFWRSGHR